MIVYDLQCCGAGHRFEGWFASSDDFASQQARGLVTCPHCGAVEVEKAPMAPRLARKGNQLGAAPAVAAPVADAPLKPVSLGARQMPELPPEMPAELRAKLAEALNKVATAQAQALKTSQWVGKDFAEKARAMHYGDQPPALIHGQTSPQEASELAEEGVPIMPVLFPVAPPDEIH